jgi:hypothetical protein
MQKQISKEQIDNEVGAVYKPMAIESGIAILPLSDLSDRDFELLIYCLIKQELEDGEHASYTDIALMQGVSERGRDCVLYRHGKVAGLVQCKKYQGRLTKPLVIKEIIKFLLFSTLDQTILPDPKAFEYKIYVSNDLTEPAISLIHAYKNEIEIEISSRTISDYVNDVVEEYDSFSGYIKLPPVTEIEQLLRTIEVSSCNATDITMRVYKHDSILSSFFNVRTVVSLQAADKMFRTALDDYGLKVLTDEDLKVLQQRIGNIGEGNRVNLGYVDFFGFSKDFFKFLKGKAFEDILTAVASLKSALNRELLNFVMAEINKRILLHITVKLLGTGKIHPFSVGIAMPYLFDRISVKIITGTIPKSLASKINPQSALSKDELIANISEKLFESSARIMKGDYSHLVGNPADIEFKKKLYEHMHQGLSDIQDAKKVFSKDIDIIRPILDQIEDELERLVSAEQTIVIKDASFIENEIEMKRALQTVLEIDKS